MELFIGVAFQYEVLSISLKINGVLGLNTRVEEKLSPGYQSKEGSTLQFLKVKVKMIGPSLGISFAGRYPQQKHGNAMLLHGDHLFHMHPQIGRPNSLR